MVKSPANAGGVRGRFDPGWEDLEEGMAMHSSTHPCLENPGQRPGGLQPIGLRSRDTTGRLKHTATSKLSASALQNVASQSSFSSKRIPHPSKNA